MNDWSFNAICNIQYPTSCNQQVYQKIMLNNDISQITYFSSICLEFEGVYIALTSSSTLMKNNRIKNKEALLSKLSTVAKVFSTNFVVGMTLILLC